jgi:hypothetical protein
VGTWHNPNLGRPSAAPLEWCAELLGVDLATVCELAAGVEPYVRADGTRIWRLMQLERQLRPEAYGRRRAATWTVGRPRPPMHSQSGVPQAPLGYESLERRSKRYSADPKSAHTLRRWGNTNGQPSGLFLLVSARLVSKP